MITAAADRRDDNLEDAQPDVVERLQNPEGRLRYERGADDAIAMADGHGAVEREGALARSRAGRRCRSVPQRRPNSGAGRRFALPIARLGELRDGDQHAARERPAARRTRTIHAPTRYRRRSRMP